MNIEKIIYLLGRDSVKNCIKMRYPLRKTKYTRRQHPFPTFPPLLKRGTPRAGSPMLLLTKETVKKHRHSAHEF